MIGLSLWIVKDPSLPVSPGSETDHVCKILGANSDYFSTYFIVTNSSHVRRKIRDYSSNSFNLIWPNYEDFEKEYKEELGISGTLAPNFLSDYAALWGNLICCTSEPVMYVDADFLITNPMLVDELSRKLPKRFYTFKDRSFYQLNSDPYYINAHLTIQSPCETLQLAKVDWSKKLQTLLSSKSLSYRDLGPRFFGECIACRMNLLDNIQPTVPPFRTMRTAVGTSSQSIIEIPYEDYSLGVHLLFSLFRQSGLQIKDLEINHKGLKLTIKNLNHEEN